MRDCVIDNLGWQTDAAGTLSGRALVAFTLRVQRQEQARCAAPPSVVQTTNRRITRSVRMLSFEPPMQIASRSVVHKRTAARICAGPRSL